MNLRYRLLLAFALVALGALSFFGYIAFETAAETGKKRDIALLRQVFTRAEGELSAALALGSDHVNAVLDDVSWDFGDALSVVIVDAQGNRRYRTTNIQPYTRIARLLPSGAESGQILDGNYAFTWFRQAVAGGEAPLLAYFVYKVDQKQNSSYLRQMTISLAFAACIVLWVAGWAGMYVAKLIEKLRDQKKSLRHQALHDVLTGLPNRTLLGEKLREYLTGSAADQEGLALCFIDLNRFKEVNDTLGHHCGDELLVQVSQRLTAGVRRCDLVARLGGDEFAVILRHVDQDGMKMVVSKIVETVEEAISIDGNKLFVTCSIGTSLFPEHGRDVDTLLRKADIAMYCAKRSGRRHVVFSDDLKQGSDQPLSLMGDLRDAIRSGELEVYYQPKIDVRDRSVVGAEALARWRHPKLGFVPPPELIAMSEKTGLIADVSLHIVATAFRDYSALRGGGRDFSLAINLSSYNLFDPQFIDALIELKNRYRINPRNIIFELTENAVISDPRRIEEALRKLAALEFRLALDDFGAGHSSFLNLKRLPIDEIKLDRSFITNLDCDEGDAAIVRATVGLGQALGIRVVAEGVESELILQRVAQLGCQEAQGYLISKPLARDAFIGWLDGGSRRPMKLLPFVAN